MLYGNRSRCRLPHDQDYQFCEGMNGNNIRECSPVHPDEARIATCMLLLGLFPDWDRLTGNNATDGMEE